MQCKEQLAAYLREHQVPFETQHHPTAFTAQEVAASERIPGQQLAKVVMVIADGQLVMLALPAPQRVDLSQLSAVLGATDVRLAEETEFADRFPECDVGAMPPFGNLYNLPIYVDRSLTENETIFCQAGTHTETISLRYADFERLVNPTVATFARQE